MADVPPEMLQALQASMAAAFTDRDAARRQFFNGDANVSDDMVDTAIEQFRESLRDPAQAAQMFMAMAAITQMAPPPPQDLEMPPDDDDDDEGMPTLEDQAAPSFVFRPPPPPVNDTPTTAAPESEEDDEYSEEDDDNYSEEENDEPATAEDAADKARRVAYERALAKFPYQGDLGRAQRAQDREAIRIINRMRTAFETREVTVAIEAEARDLVKRKRAEAPRVQAPAARRRALDEEKARTQALQQRSKAEAASRAAAEAELQTKRDKKAAAAAQVRARAEAEALRKAARKAEAARLEEEKARAEAERVAARHDAEAAAQALAAEARTQREAAAAAAAQREAHARKPLKLKCAGTGAVQHADAERVTRKCARGCVELYAQACRPAWVAEPRRALNGDRCGAHALCWSEARAFTRGDDWASRGALDVTLASLDDPVRDDAPVVAADTPTAATAKVRVSDETGVVWAGPLGQRTTNATALALAKGRLGDDLVKDVQVADEALLMTALRGKLASPWAKDRPKLPKDVRCCRFRVPGGHAAAKRVARALRGDADDPKKFPFKLRAVAMDAGEEALLEQALRDVAKAKTKTPATTKAPAMGGRKGAGGGIRGGGNKKMLGPATTRPPRQRVGEHPLYKPEGAPPSNARPVAADFPILGAARTTTAADFPALNGAAWQPAPAPEDFPATLGAAPVSRTNWRPEEAATPAAAPEAFPTLSTGGGGAACGPTRPATRPAPRPRPLRCAPPSRAPPRRPRSSAPRRLRSPRGWRTSRRPPSSSATSRRIRPARTRPARRPPGPPPPPSPRPRRRRSRPRCRTRGRPFGTRTARSTTSATHRPQRSRGPCLSRRHPRRRRHPHRQPTRKRATSGSSPSSKWSNAPLPGARWIS